MISEQNSPSRTADADAVLVVDDDAVALRLLTRMLTDVNCRVIACTRAADALDNAAQGQVSAVISDIAMPGMSGFTLLKRLRERHLGMPVILVTGRTDASYESMSIDYGAFAFLEKPFDRQSVRHLVEGACSYYHSVRAKS